MLNILNFILLDEMRMFVHLKNSLGIPANIIKVIMMGIEIAYFNRPIIEASKVSPQTEI